MSLVSVIVPVYNGQKYLRRCLDSLVNQTLKDIEIIIVNDGSTDESPVICDEYAKNDSRIKVIHQNNTGQGIARSNGIKKAKSLYIGFVDADDWVERKMFETLYNEALKQNSDIVMCNCFEIINGVSQKTYINTEDSVLDHDKIIKQIIAPMIGGKSLDDHYKNSIPGYMWRCLYKSSLIKPIQIISERKILFEDLWFNIQAMYASNKVAILNNHLYHYVHYEDSFVRTYKNDIWERKKRLNTLILNFIKDNNLYEATKKRVHTRYVIDLLESINNETSSKNKKTLKQQKEHIKSICLDDKIQEAINNVELGNISTYQKIRIKLIKRRYYNIVYYLSKSGHYLKFILKR